jgi:hypothetical protein
MLDLAGAASTDIWMHNQREIRMKNMLVYGSVIAIVLLMFDNFHAVEEMAGHITKPAAFTVYVGRCRFTNGVCQRR